MESFIETDESKVILKACEQHQLVVIRGPFGSGKSITAYHAAFKLESNNGYSIFPANDPENIKQCTHEDGRVIFIFDDIFGKYIFNEITYDRWIKSIDEINILLNHKKDLKLIITCRSQLYMPTEIYNLEVHSRLVYHINLTSSDIEKFNENLRGETIDRKFYDFPFFPLIYRDVKKGVSSKKSVHNQVEDELKELKNNNLSSYIALEILVVLNNLVGKQYFDNGSPLIHEIIASLINEIQCKCVINHNTLNTMNMMNVFFELEGTYVLENELGFTSINSEMFNCIASCIGKEICQTILKYADNTFVRERLVFQSVKREDMDNLIYIPNDLHKRYFERVIKMLNTGNEKDAMENVQSNNKSYRSALIDFITSIRTVSNNYDESVNHLKALHVCIELGYSDIVNYILSIDSNLANTPDRSEDYPLTLACEFKQYECAEVLIQNKADVNKKNKQLNSPLHIACQKRNKQLVELLIKNKADVNSCSDSCGTPIFIACNDYLDEVELLHLLVNSGGEINKGSSNGSTPLHEACANGRKNIVDFLLQNKKIQINGTDASGRTPLLISCQNGFTDLVDTLLMKGVSVTKADNNGQAPLHIAASGGLVEISELLLKHKASINQICKCGYTPLTLACRKGSLDLVHLFLNFRADINGLSEKYQLTPLYEAYTNNHNYLSKYLLQQVNDIKHTNCKYMFFFTACTLNYVDGVKYLIQKLSIDVNYMYKNHGETALCIATRQNNLELVKLLLKHKARVNLYSKNGWTPLCLACKTGDTNIIELLISHNATISRATKSGLTPLFISCLFKNEHITTLLLTHSPTIVNDGDRHGWTPLQLSCFIGNVESVELLLEYKATVNFNSMVRWKGLLKVQKHLRGRKSEMVVQRHKVVNNYFKIKQTPLSILFWKQNETAIKFLFENGADINQGESNDNFKATNEDCEKYVNFRKNKITSQQSFHNINELTPLQIACYKNHIDVIKLLVLHNAAINMFTPNGIITRERISYKQLVEKMDINAKTLPFVRPLTIAIKKRNLNLVQLLLEHNADVNLTSKDGSTPLHLAILEDALEIVKLLLNKRYKCETSHCMHDVGTPLILACSMNNYHVVEMLVQHGAAVNQVGDVGQTALQCACKQDNINIVRLLLEKGAEISPKGQQGPSPLQTANQDIHELLLQYNIRVRTGRMHYFVRRFFPTVTD